MPYAQPNEPKLTRIDVQPKRRPMKVKTQQQLKVIARYSDGSARDVTQLALYEPNDKSMAEATEAGLVKTLDLPGNVAVMVRYQGKCRSSAPPSRSARRSSSCRRRRTSSTSSSSRT